MLVFPANTQNNSHHPPGYSRGSLWSILVISHLTFWQFTCSIPICRDVVHWFLKHPHFWGGQLYPVIRILFPFLGMTAMDDFFNQTPSIMNNLKKNLILDFGEEKLNCLEHKGLILFPVSEICALIDIDYNHQKNKIEQGEYLKNQNYYEYSGDPADGNIYIQMTYVEGWLHSISQKGRKKGSVGKQEELLIWLRNLNVQFLTSQYNSIKYLKKEKKLLEEKVTLMEGVDRQRGSINLKLKRIKGINEELLIL